MALAAAVAYLPSIRYGFIYDDYWTIVGNRHLDKSLRELLRAAVSGRSVEWQMPDATRPLMGVSLWVDRQLFGLSPAGHHLHSVGLYAAVSVAVFLLGFALFRSFAAALGAGLSFAVAPLHAEVVAAVNYREDLLAALGMLGAAVLCFWPASRAAKARPYLVAALWLYALLGKESAFIAPLFVLTLCWVRRPERWLLRSVLPLASAVAGAIWLNWRFGMSVLGEQIPLAKYSGWGERLLRTARFELWSLGNSLLPLRTRPEHDPLSSPSWLWLGAFLVVLAGVFWLARASQTRRGAGLLAAALVAPLLTSPLCAPVNELADRYWFVGSVAAALFIGWGTRALSRRQMPLALAVLAGMSAAGIALSRSAASVWASETSLWTYAVATAPHSPRAWSQLSRAHRMANQPELAERAVERALALRPDYVPGQVARALNHLWAGGRREAAREVLTQVVPQSKLHRDALALVKRCAAQKDDLAAQACARRAVPRGLVLGDAAELQRASELLLARTPVPQ